MGYLSFPESRKLCKDLVRASQAEERTTSQTCWEDAKNTNKVRDSQTERKEATQIQNAWAPAQTF